MYQNGSDRFSRRHLLSSAIATGVVATAGPALTGSSQFAALGQGSPIPTGTGPDVARGTLRSATSVAELTVDEVSGELAAFGLDAGRVRFGVSAARIVYATIDSSRRPTTASGLVALPTNGVRAPRPAIWLHGTMVYRGDAASVAAESPDRALTFALAAAGYAAIAPDYLGLGEGPGPHPYNHAPSAVSASVDALRAARVFAAERERRLHGETLVTGFSWGGRVALELGRALQEGADQAFGVAALAPISGPYDFSGTLRAGLAGEIFAAPQYLAFLVVAWNRIYHLYDTPSDAFRAPYDATVEGLFDGTYTGDEVFAGLPVEAPRDLFTPDFMALLQNPSGPLRDALADADGSVDWRPQVPVDLYAARGDRDVPIANAEHALEALQARGADVRLVDVGDVDHTTSVVLSLPQLLSRFDAVWNGR